MSSASTAKKFSKRDEYTSHACTECQRRKVKCSGQSPCHNCLGRGADCTYDSVSKGPGKRRRKQSSSSPNKRPAAPASCAPVSASDETALLKDQLARLQKGLDALMMQQLLGVDLLGSQPTPRVPNSTEESAILADARLASFSQTSDAFEPQQHTTRDVDGGSPRSFQDGRRSVEPAYSETDTFVPGAKWLNHFAVASQISDLRSSVGAGPVLTDPTTPSSYTVELPGPQGLAQAIKVGLAAMHCFFPSVHGKKLVEAISRTLKSLGYPSLGQSVAVNEPHHMVISILLIVISTGQLLDGRGSSGACPEKAWPGSESYWQSRNLVQHFEGGSETQTSEIIYHTMAAGYLLSAERLRLASTHILNGLHSAVSVGLGQSHGFTATFDDLADPLALWVTLDFLDKRITQKCGIPYFVGNSLGHVDIDHHTGAHIDAKSKAYLKTMFSHARLWASVWDGFLAPNAPMATDWVEIQAFDAKLLALREQYPDNLSWTPESVGESIFSSSSPEHEDRRRLLVFLRCQCLRLSIRHRPLSPPEINARRAESCLGISIESLDAIGHYLDKWGKCHSAGYIITSSLVEAIYYLTLGHREGIPPLDPEAMSAALHRAGGMLEGLATTIMSAARAFKALQCVLNFNFQESRSDYDLVFPIPGFSETNKSLGIQFNQARYLSSPNTFGDFSKSFDGMVSDTQMMESGLEIDSLLSNIFYDIEAR